MNWSEKTWEAALPVYRAITEMPFIKELIAGTLPREKFLFYIRQDDIYLGHYAQVLSTIAARVHSAVEALAFVRFAESALLVEQGMHDTFYKEAASDSGAASGDKAVVAALAAVGIEPACHHYTSFLKSTAALEPVEVAMAAVLPCFWIYREVGLHILAGAATTTATSGAANPYQAWIDTYSGEEFSRQVDEAIEFCDAAAERSTHAVRERMTEAYVTAARLEFDFWDGAYRLRKW
jgi:thiaminase/transcriptional activator TenA